MLSVSRTKWCLVLVALVSLSSAASLSAQQNRDNRRPDQGGGRGGGFPFGGGGGGGLMLLQREDVQGELDLLDDQKKQLTDLREKSTEKMREAFRAGAGGGGDREALQATMRKFTEETQAELDKVLLPHQSKRLKQLETQLAMRGRGVLGALGGDLAEKIGIAEDQREKLREKAQDLDNELRKKTAELRKQAQDQLLASLTEEQRKQFNEMIGEPFEFKDEPGQGFGGFGGGGPGGGGPGGGRRPSTDRPKND